MPLLSPIDVLKFFYNAEKDAIDAGERALRHHLPKAVRDTWRVTMTPGDIHLDYDAILKAIPAGVVEAAAKEIAANVDVGDVDAQVGVMMGTTERGAPVALVSILHPAGMAMEAKHGTLKKAAAACGLEVKSK